MAARVAVRLYEALFMGLSLPFIIRIRFLPTVFRKDYPPPAPAFSRQEAPILAKRSTFFR